MIGPFVRSNQEFSSSHQCDHEMTACVGESHPVDGRDVIKESNVSEYSMVQQAETIVEPDTGWTLVTRHKGTRVGGPRATTSHRPRGMEKTIKISTSTRYEVNESKKCSITSYFE